MTGEKVNPVLTEMARARAMAEPLPGTLAEAFLNDAIDVHGIKVRRAVASDFVLMRWLDSPIYRQMLESQKPKEKQEPVEYAAEEAFEIAFQFTRSPKETRAIQAKGRQAFREAAIEEFGDRFPNMAVAESVVEAAAEQMKKAWATGIENGSPEPAEKKT